MNTQPNLTSRVCAGCPSVLPLRPSVSFFTTGTPVPSICTYRMGIGSPTTMGRSSWTARWISCLLACAISLADGLGRALHRFGGHFQTGQKLHLLAAVIERSLLAHQQPACGARRERVPVFQCPVRHRRETGPRDSAGTNNRAATLAPGPRR